MQVQEMNGENGWRKMTNLKNKYGLLWNHQ